MIAVESDIFVNQTTALRTVATYQASLAALVAEGRIRVRQLPGHRRKSYSLADCLRVAAESTRGQGPSAA
jgi:hypothetical protein